jgi:hypothetical protein
MVPLPHQECLGSGGKREEVNPVTEKCGETDRCGAPAWALRRVRRTVRPSDLSAAERLTQQVDRVGVTRAAPFRQVDRLIFPKSIGGSQTSIMAGIRMCRSAAVRASART